jgi:hypothetical protein
MSRLVKIVLAQDISLDDYGDYYSRNIIRDSITDWEEVSDEDFNFLRGNLSWLFRSVQDAGMTPCLLVKDEQPIVQRIQSVKDEIRKYEENQRKQREKAEQEKAERARKRLLKQAKSELELLTQLQEKYGIEAAVDPEKAVETLVGKSGRAKTVK